MMSEAFLLVNECIAELGENLVVPRQQPETRMSRRA